MLISHRNLLENRSGVKEVEEANVSSMVAPLGVTPADNRKTTVLRQNK